NVVTDPVDSLAGALRCENIKSNFKPGIKTVSNFDGLVQRVIGGEKSVLHGLRALKRKIAVQFHHGVMRLDSIRAINLNFVIVLRRGSRARESRKRHSDYKHTCQQFFHSKVPVGMPRKNS